MRFMFLMMGLVSTGLGFTGILLPGLPATPFFLLAAYCFARSNRRLEQWVLNLPRVGQAIRDFRAGKGIPLRAKIAATIIILLTIGFTLTTLDNLWLQITIVIAVLIGQWILYWKIPTRKEEE